MFFMVCMIVAAVFFLVSALGVAAPRINFLGLGLFFMALAFALQGVVRH